MQKIYLDDLKNNDKTAETRCAQQYPGFFKVVRSSQNQRQKC